MFEKNSEAIKSAGPVEIVGPVLGFELKDYPDITPSSAERIVIFFNLNHVSESLWQQGRIMVEINGLKENKTTRRTFELELKDYPYKKILGITHSIPARDFSPDYYEIRLTLLNGSQKILDQETSRFIISPKEIVPHPAGRRR